MFAGRLARQPTCTNLLTVKSPGPALACRDEHAYVYARLPNLIQGQGQLAAKLTFQPASLQARTRNTCHCASGHACLLLLLLPPALAACVPSM